jgi:chromosome segregation ATPase
VSLESRLRRRYGRQRQRLAKLEKEFDAFVRSNMDDPEARAAYAAEANRKYFKLTEQMASTREQYARAKNGPP